MCKSAFHYGTDFDTSRVVLYSAFGQDIATGGDFEGEVVLVDADDAPIGFAPKLQAHQDGGRLHRAFSVFIFNAAGQMLLQRRALTKYHFGGLWSNACCSHPRPGDDTLTRAQERLRQEMGVSAPLRPLFTFVYRAQDSVSGLTEHEFDHVFVGKFNGEPCPHPIEVAEWHWIDLSLLWEEIGAHPERFTPWFRIALPRLAECLAASRPESSRV